jgi:hypothetical protein
MGLHQEIKADREAPFFLLELRKNAFASIYSADKDVATFLGRPPRISRHCCTPQLPLDLDSNEIVAEGNDLQKVLPKFDVNGWNRNGILSWASVARARMLMRYIREDILKLSLGPLVENLEQRSR